MSENAQQLEPEIDWETLILDVQTSPEVESSEAFGYLYDRLYGFIHTLAKKWLERHYLSEAQDNALVAIGLDKILNEICKFDIPEDDSDGIGRAFKSWVSICCRREWSSSKHIHRELPLDEVGMDSHPSIEEELVSAEAEGSINTERQQAIEVQRQILNDELDRLPESMREAILETEDLKAIENLTGRGRKGEAAAIASKHNLTPGAIRTARCRLGNRVKQRYQKEFYT